MSKRDTFKQNILALTRRRSLASAFKGWEVERLIGLTNKQKPAACELCGTNFYRGAYVRHPARKSTIAIGGTCLETILVKRFHDRREVIRRKKALVHTLETEYRLVPVPVDPGNWIKWVVENAPARYASQVADLQFLGTVKTDRDLRLLIRFHDRHRLYPRESLIEDWRVAKALVPIPENLTLEQWRKLMRELGRHKGAIAARRAQRYRSKELLPVLRENPDLDGTYQRLTKLGQMSVVALCALSDQRAEADMLCPPALAKAWLAVAVPIRMGQFIWNPK